MIIHIKSTNIEIGRQNFLAIVRVALSLCMKLYSVITMILQVLLGVGVWVGAASTVLTFLPNRLTVEKKKSETQDALDLEAVLETPPPFSLSFKKRYFSPN